MTGSDATREFIEAVDAWLKAVDTWQAEVRQLTANAIPEELEGETFTSDAVEQAAQAVLRAGRPAMAAVIARGADAAHVAQVARYVASGDGEALFNVREVWPRVSAELEVVAAAAGKNPDSDDEPDAGKLDGEAKALALLVEHPDWTNAKIAEHVPCKRTQLYRWPLFMAAREQQESARLELKKGSKRNGRIDAY